VRPERVRQGIVLEGWADSGAVVMVGAMSALQADLFGTASHTSEKPSDEIVELVRRRLHATLALVKAAEAMPWSDQLAIIREDNAFRFGKEVLPAAEGEALWAEFDVEMNRLYAIMNEGKEPDLDD
jgi:hypothetical protein